MKIEPHIESVLPQLELRVLHGPQSGSRLALAPGDYLLGTDDECAIILAGPKMEAMHARLRFDGDRPSIDPVDGGVLDTDGSAITQPLPLALGMPIELGGIWIAIDEVDAPWPDLEAIIPRPGTRPPVSDEDSEENDARAFGDKALPTDQTDAPVIPDDEQQRRHARRMLAGSLTLLLLVALAGVSGAIRLLGQSAQATAKIQEEPAALVQLRARLQEIAPGRQINVTMSGGVHHEVRGYVLDEPMEAMVRDAIRKIANTPAVYLVLDSQLLVAARKAAQGLQDPARALFKVNDVVNGIASVSGTVSSVAVREEVLEALRKGVPELRGTEASMRLAADLPGLLQEKIAVAGLSRRLQVVDDQPEFIVRGTLSEEELPRWEALLASFSSEFGKLLPIRATIMPLKRLLPVNVQTVIGGQMPFVITDRGQRIGPGGEAGNHTLSAIGDKEIIFDGRQRIRIPR